MRQKISRSDAIQLISQAREAVSAPDRLQALLIDYGTNTIFDALQQAYAGVSNGFLSQVCEAILGLNIEVIGEPEARLRCPCCQRQTLGELFDPEAGTGYDICGHCGWEDDGTQDPKAHSGVNRGSMAEYRERMDAEFNYYFCDKWRT